MCIWSLLDQPPAIDGHMVLFHPLPLVPSYRELRAGKIRAPGCRARLGTQVCLVPELSIFLLLRSATKGELLEQGICPAEKVVVKDTWDGKHVVVVGVEVAMFQESDVLPGVIELGHVGADRKREMPTDVFTLSASVFSEIGPGYNPYSPQESPQKSYCTESKCWY